MLWLERNPREDRRQAAVSGLAGRPWAGLIQVSLQSCKAQAPHGKKQAQRSEGALSHSCPGAEQTTAAHAFRAMQLVTLRSPVSYHHTAMVWVGRHHSHLDSNPAQGIKASVAKGWVVTPRLLRAFLSIGALSSQPPALPPQPLWFCSAPGHPFFFSLSTKA